MRPGTLAVILCVVVASIVAASCGSSTSPQAPKTNILFSDDFGGQFPGLNWTVTGGTAPIIDATQGNPAPSLQFPSFLPDGLPATSYSSIQSVNAPFDTAKGITISAQLGFPTLSPVYSQFWVYDQVSALGGGPHAYVYLDQTMGTATYYIATQVNPEVTVNNSLTADAKFHKYTFKVDASGNATWSRDGVVQASTTAFSCSTLGLKFVGGWTGDTYLDNVSVTVP